MSGVLVVGAAGLIGRAVLTEAERSGLAVGAVVARASESLPTAHALRLSPATLDPLARLLERTRPRAIVNCAGRTAGDPGALLQANVEPVACILEAMRLVSVEARLVHLGSAAEYAELPDGPTGEDAATDAASPYAAAKLAAFHLVSEAGDAGVDTVVARVFNPIGPGMPSSSLPGRAARLLLEATASGAGEVVLGPLDAIRDYVDPRDIASAVLLLATAPDLGHRVINVGSGRPTAVRDLVGMLADRVGFAGRIRESATGSPRSGGMARQVADIGRLRALGWGPAYDLGESVDALISSVDFDGRAR